MKLTKVLKTEEGTHPDGFSQGQTIGINIQQIYDWAIKTAIKNYKKRKQFKHETHTIFINRFISCYEHELMHKLITAIVETHYPEDTTYYGEEKVVYLMQGFKWTAPLHKYYKKYYEDVDE